MLLGRLIDVLSWGAVELSRLETYAKYWKDEEKSLLRLQDKVAGEAVLLAYLASRVPLDHGSLRDAAEVLLDRAKVHVDTGRNEALLRRFPQTVATLGGVFVLLSQLGRGNRTIEQLLRSALDQGFATLSESSPYRLMDTRWTYSLLEPGLVRPVEELLPFSTLGASPHPIYTMNEDDYALTHGVFYLTDFGRKSLPIEHQKVNIQLLDPFLIWNAIREDLDLLGEFLIAALALRQSHSPSFRFAWHLFFKAWGEDQELVGPEFSSIRLAELRGEEAASYTFSQNYHTAFVGGILCAVALTVPQTDGQTQGSGCTPYSDRLLAIRCSDAAARAREALRRALVYEPFIPEAVDLPKWSCSRLFIVLRTSPNPAPMCCGQQWIAICPGESWRPCFTMLSS